MGRSKPPKPAPARRPSSVQVIDAKSSLQGLDEVKESSPRAWSPAEGIRFVGGDNVMMRKPPKPPSKPGGGRIATTANFAELFKGAAGMCKNPFGGGLGGFELDRRRVGGRLGSRR